MTGEIPGQIPLEGFDEEPKRGQRAAGANEGEAGLPLAAGGAEPPETAGAEAQNAEAPWAEILRPRTLDDLVGQPHLTGPEGVFRALLAAERIPSIVLWGPPGSGKTTLARFFQHHPGYAWEQFSAVLSGVKDVREVVERARRRLAASGRRTLLFVDEIHRFNRAQQDAFLPHVESGTITLIGATTENPSFHVNPALLSRCRVYVLRELGEDDLAELGRRALAKLGVPLALTPESWTFLARLAGGDARRLLLSLETLTQIAPRQERLDPEAVERCLHTGSARNLGSEDHFNWISALHKSVRGSDPHAALYWLVQMLEAGEDPRYVSRRLVRMAAEDIGLAEPGALAVALSARDAYEQLGAPEGHLALAECAVYLALCPKSNSIYQAYRRAREALARHGSQPVPIRLRNPPTALMKDLGYGKEYRYAQDEPGRFVAESYLPEGWSDGPLYRPSRQGRESRMVEDHRRRTEDFYRLDYEEPAGEGDGHA